MVAPEGAGGKVKRYSMVYKLPSGSYDRFEGTADECRNELQKLGVVSEEVHSWLWLSWDQHAQAAPDIDIEELP
jgi:hypothetical protein